MDDTPVLGVSRRESTVDSQGGPYDSESEAKRRFLEREGELMAIGWSKAADGNFYPRPGDSIWVELYIDALPSQGSFA